MGSCQRRRFWGRVMATFAAGAILSIGVPVPASARSARYQADARGWSPGASSPDYKLDLTQIAIQSDEADAVFSASGYAALTFQSISGQTYEVDSTNALPPSPTLAQVETFYNSQTARALAGLNPTIAASAFSLEGASLPAIRTLIIANVSSEVASYQVFRISFHGPFGRPRA